MIEKTLTCIAFICLVSTGLLQAQDTGSKKRTDNPKRTLRIIVAGKRPMPAFQQIGNKVVEIDPPLSLLPPTSFSFVKKSHAPRSKPGSPKKSSYSSSLYRLIRIKNYKGPSTLPLKLSRPLLEANGAGQKVNCNLGKITHPLILLYADSKKLGWKNPQAMVIDVAPNKVPEHSVTFINFTPAPLRIHVTKKGIIAPPNKHITVPLPKSSKESFRYKIEAYNGKKVVTVSNSRYRIKKGSRVIMFALPGTQIKRGSYPTPKLSIITDSL